MKLRILPLTLALTAVLTGTAQAQSLVQLYEAAKGYDASMSVLSAKQIKRREGDARMACLEVAGRSPADARAQQTRVSLVGDGRKWRITNLQKAVRVMASWR